MADILPYQSLNPLQVDHLGAWWKSDATKEMYRGNVIRTVLQLAEFSQTHDCVDIVRGLSNPPDTLGYHFVGRTTMYVPEADIATPGINFDKVPGTQSFHQVN
jgi:hypothetical protein